MLLPGSFQKVGWWILIPTLLIGILMAIDGFNGVPSFIYTAPTKTAMHTLGVLEPILIDIAIIGILIGAIFITCSRRKIEDEMIGRVRLDALLLALYIHIGIVIICALLFYDFDYLNAMIYNLFTLPLLFLIIFQWKLWRLGKEAADEK